MLGAILVIIALVLAILDLVAWRHNHPQRYFLLPLAVVLVCIALLIGVSPLIASKG